MRVRTAGFSLLEVLISLVVLSTIVVAFSSTLGTGLRVWERARWSEEVAQLEALGRHRLRDIIELLPTRRAAAVGTSIFIGRADEMRLTVPAAEFGYHSTELVKFILRPESVSDKLDIRLYQIGPGELRSTYLVASGVTSFEFRYLKEIKSGEVLVEKGWESSRAFPSLVTIIFDRPHPNEIPRLSAIPGWQHRQKVMSRSSF